MIINLAQKQATLEGIPLQLTSLEANILTCLSRYLGQLVDYETLVSEAWGDMSVIDKRAIYTAVYRLKTKIGEGYIESVKGRGYVMQNLEGAGKKIS